MYSSRHFLHYFRLTPDRRLLFGGRARFVPETHRRSLRARRYCSVDAGVYPQLRDVRVEYAWGGTLDFAFDTMPHAGRADGCYFALGYAGHGVALATLLGAKVGEAIATGGIDAKRFRENFVSGRAAWLYWGQPWFLPLVAARYKLLDWIG